MSLFIKGRWQKGEGEAFASTNPADQNVIWQGQAASLTQVDLAMQAARGAFHEWAQTPIKERIAILKKCQTVIGENQKEITECISLETGKALWECETETASMLGKFDSSFDAYQERSGEKTKKFDDYQLHLRHRPHGVMGIFVPFNFPAHLFNTHTVPALLAGNTVVIKPSEQTPKTAELITQIWDHIGLPDGVVNLLQGGSDTGKALSTHEDLNGLCFTGSYKIGQILHQQFSRDTDKLLALEMGGNNPMIVGEVSDLHAAVLNIIQSAFISSGQRCTCTRRLIIIESAQTDDLLELLIEKTAQIRVGYPDATPEPFMGTVINAQAGEHVLEKQQALQDLGGENYLDCRAIDKHNPALLAPGLIDMTDCDNIPDEEIFGPLLQIYRVNDLTSAIQLANQTAYGLTAGILCDDKKHYEQFLQHAQAGIVNWNRPTTGSSGIAPFGGLGHSGNFRPSGYYAADYCAYPVASLESNKIVIPRGIPGLPTQKA